MKNIYITSAIRTAVGSLGKSLKNINFPFDQIKKFYFFESKRWDLVTNRNQTIKLPINNYEKSLKSYSY